MRIIQRKLNERDRVQPKAGNLTKIFALFYLHHFLFESHYQSVDWTGSSRNRMK